MSDTILSADQGHWTKITLNPPDKLNNFYEEMHLELQETLKRAVSAKEGVASLTGVRRGLCAGREKRKPAFAGR